MLCGDSAFEEFKGLQKMSRLNVMQREMVEN